MQFGRFHGIALLALDALLLLVQTVVIFTAKSPAAEIADSSQQPAAVQPNRGWLPPLDYLPGVLGIVLAGAGAFVLARVSHEGTRKRLGEERREEDRSFGRQDVSTPTIWKDR